jgi:type IV secretory pathway TraG/TraD family ATPase VirD4
MIKLLLFLANSIVTVFILLVGQCFTISLSADVLPDEIYRLVEVTKFSLGSLSLSFYKCNFSGLWAVIRDHGQEMYIALGIKYLLPFIIALAFWYVCYILIARGTTLAYNRKTTLHGSSRWMTQKEMEDLGLLNKAGVVLGQTADAKYKEEKSEKPKRKKGEQQSDYETRLEKWSPKDTELKLVQEGDIIAQNSNHHTLVVGSTRSGKGVSCIIPTEFEWNESIMIMDPKAEGWGISGRYRSRFSYTFKFEPEKPSQSIHYNPLLAVRRGRQTIPDIQNLALILIPYNENAKDPFWDNEARKLLAAVMGYVIYCEPPERKTFRQVYSVFTASLDEITPTKAPTGSLQEDKMAQAEEEDADESAVKKYLRQYAKNAAMYNASMPVMSEELRERFNNRHKMDKKAREEVEKEAMQYLTEDDKSNLDRFQQDLTYFANCEDRQLSSVVSTMTSNLQVIADPNVQEVTDRSDFVMEDFVQGVLDENGRRHPISLYLCVSVASMRRLVPLMRILYEQAITLLTQDITKKNPYRLLLVFDEFYQMGRMEIVEKALAISAGYGVLCTIVIQSYAQLQKLYQNEAVFTDNFAYQLILKVNELKTCEKISAMLGKETKRQKRLGTSGSVYSIAGNSTSLNVEQVGRDLMTAEEVMHMGDNDCLIFMSGEHPYKAKKIRYYLDERFRKFYLDKGGKMLPPPESKKDLEENQPHPEAVKNGKRVGVDDEGWMLLLGYNGAVPEFELKTSSGVKSQSDFIQDEALDPENIEADSLNEIDALYTSEEILDLMGLDSYPEQSQNQGFYEMYQYFQAERERYHEMQIQLQQDDIAI